MFYFNHYNNTQQNSKHCKKPNEVIHSSVFQQFLFYYIVTLFCRLKYLYSLILDFLSEIPIYLETRHINIGFSGTGREYLTAFKVLVIFLSLSRNVNFLFLRTLNRQIFSLKCIFHLLRLV